ncbi:hypothetical protein XBJ2_430032 [Xenorhabdus bovienii str. Jollieti]|nr:hypothetical protein XBJ2_430032 [Xenorhabdus bovienii str. Jollieti]
MCWKTFSKSSGGMSTIKKPSEDFPRVFFIANLYDLYIEY